ncbi:hypothetical protein XELAEV_18001257mg [Xenopus laevis]|uniref:EGF-like domain-containing protein n=1 Tax=Xenopus laevis TaxID=8355 RepID=A0A974BP78_XENLA|nr:hypothetical protein XELAEV_18001257mg [Xenopus laevis]
MGITRKCQNSLIMWLNCILCCCSFLCRSLDACPNNCSGRGDCTQKPNGDISCDCAENWKGEACDIPYCLDNCGLPTQGVCDVNNTKSCICEDGWQGQ